TAHTRPQTAHASARQGKPRMQCLRHRTPENPSCPEPTETRSCPVHRGTDRRADARAALLRRPVYEVLIADGVPEFLTILSPGINIISGESRPFRAGRNRVTDRDVSGLRCTP